MTQSDDQQTIQLFVDGVAASLGLIERDPQRQLVVVACNRHFSEMFGGGSKLTETTPFLLKDLVPRYNRLEFLDNINRSIDNGRPLEFEQVYDLKTGTRWWRISVNPIVEKSGKVIRLLVTGQDITIKVELEHQLKLASSRFASVVEAAYDCIITINQRERIVLFNKAAQELFGYHEDEILGESLEMLIPSRFRDHHSDHIDRFALSPIRSRQMEERGRVLGLHKDGTEFPVEIAISKIHVGGLVEFTAIVRDISEKVRLLDQLAQQATTDHLTGLLNRRELEDRAQELIEGSRRQGEPLSLLLLDVDKFKTINDTFGHEAGDEVLQLLARVAAQTIRHLDVVARLGGEEFVVMMPETDKAQALAMAERLRRIYERQSFEHSWKQDPIPFTVSIGVTTLTTEDDDLAKPLKRADEALYRAKNNGRNRIEYAD